MSLLRSESRVPGQPSILIVLTKTAQPDPGGLAKILIEGVQKTGRPALLRVEAEDEARAMFCWGEPVEVDFSSPVSTLLARTELVIHQGDKEISTEVFRAGVPAVLVPHTEEQKIWAEMARAKGCARNVIPASQLNADRLAAAIRGTLDRAELRRNTNALASLISEAKDADAARGVIEASLENGGQDKVQGLEGGWRQESVSSIPPLRKADRAALVPLSYAQERLWFLFQLDRGSSAYNMPLALRLRGELNAEALRRTMIYITRRHEILRTVFTMTDDGPRQRIIPDASPDFQYAGAPPGPSLSESEALKIASAEAELPFDLEEGPMLRVRLLRLAGFEHVLLLNTHHIVADGWSIVVLMREITDAYRAYSEGREPELPQVDLHYADFAVWQREWLKGEALERELHYWRSQLAGSSLLELATDHPRNPAASYLADSARLRIAPALLQRIKREGRQAGATLFIVLMTAFQVVLGKYSGQRDIAAGTAIANRGRKELEAIIGFFVNTLVLRTSLDGDPEMRDVLQRVKRVALEAYQHQNVPFEKLVQELHPQRSGSGVPLIQLMLILENTGPWNLKFGEAEISPLAADISAAKLELTLSVREERGGLAGELVYARALYEKGTMSRLLAHWQRVLEQMTETPNLRMGQLALLGEDERAQLLLAPNRTEASYPSLCVHAMMEKQAGITPHAVAVEFEGRGMSYSELNFRANQVARFLQGFGLRPESLVAICMHRGLELMPVLLGILKSGAAYVPLDPSYPRQRLEYMLQDSNASLVLTAEGALPLSGAAHCPIVDLDQAWETIGRGSGDKIEDRVFPENLAYAIYTSGSTGGPKGVAIAHGGLANFLFFMRDALGLSADDVVLAHSPLSFDIACLELYLPLLVGARVRMLSRSAGMEAPVLIRELKERVTLMQATPTAWQMLVDAGWQGHTGLRTLCGGEALPLSLANNLAEASSVAWNVYGPTESTVWSLMDKLERGGERVFIGRPIANTQAYVLDEGMAPLPENVPGELYLGGAGLARSYLHRPELTAERFVPNPFHEAGGRLYRTGDIVRWKPGGKLEFLDRVDRQVKVRGHRIELGEVEAALYECEDIKRGVAIVREDTPGEKRLAAYVVPKDGKPMEVAALKASLRKKLPEYMVPDVIVWMESLPLTPSGKVDRKRLPSPVADSEQEYVGPRDAEEEMLSAIWAEVLNRPRVSVTARFFDIGGHSLLATQVLTKLRAVYGVEIPLRAIFEAPTIAELAERFRAARSSRPTPSVPLVKLERKSASGR